MNDINIERNILTPEEFFRKVDLANQNTGNTRSCPESFFNVAIEDLELENKHLIRSEFSYSKVRNVTFRSIDFEGSEFNYTDLEEVVFERCKLSRSSFDFASLCKVRFEHCWMDTSSFDNASGDIFFDHCKVHGMELHHTLAHLTFEQCSGEAMQANYCPNLSISAKNSDFHHAEFVDSTFEGEMEKCVFTNADFAGSDCTELHFSRCKMRDICITGSVGIAIADNEDNEDFEFLNN